MQHENQTIHFSGPVPDPDIFDISAWPQVWVRFPELGVTDRTTRLLAGLDQLLAQQQRFVVIWQPAQHWHEEEPHEDEKRASVWMKTHRHALRDYCGGYIYLTTDPQLQAELAEMFPKLRKMLPFAKRIASSTEQAQEQATLLLSAELAEE